MKRIGFLDGLRGLAILLVAAFHAYACWADFVPYGATYADFPLFRFGWLGVNLFFMISGFVILMTLEKCQSLGDFAKRRWLRLFPGMLLASIFLYACAYLPFHPMKGMPNWQDIFPGLTFIDPSWFEKLFKVPFKPLDEAFWTLFIEVKFYLAFGLVFFLFGRSKAVATIAAFYILFLIASFFEQYAAGSMFWHLLHTALLHLGSQYFGWFAAGAWLYIYKKENAVAYLWIALLIGILSSASTVVFLHISDFLPTFLAALLTVAFFIAVLLAPPLQKLLESRAFRYIGFVSYPFYLIHTNPMIAMINMLHGWAPWVPGLLLPLLPIALLIGVADLIARHGELAVRNVLKNLLFRTPSLAPAR